jgi:hypothetical protein
MDNETKKAKLLGRLDLKLEWIFSILLHPRKTIQKILEQEKPVWLTPLLVLSVLVIIAGLIAWPIRRDAIINGATLPADFQYYSTEMQTQFLNAQATQSSALFTFIFPVLGSLVGIWLGWFLMSSILHMSHFISGSSAEKLGYFNLTAWAMTPLLLRQVIQILAMLFSRTAISATGLSGFITATGGGSAYLAGILGQVDIYFIWQVILLLLGVVPLSGLTRTKSWTATAITLLIMVLLFALPHFLSSILSGFTTAGI